MPTDASLLAQLQTLWQAVPPPIVPPAVSTDRPPILARSPCSTIPTGSVNGLHGMETSGIEPPTPGLQSRCSPN